MEVTCLSEVRPRSRRRDWIDRVAHVVAQEPLIDTSVSLASLRSAPVETMPDAVFVGIGLCSRHRLSRALPIDVLGMLIPAERIRRTVGAKELVVLIADDHAIASGFDEEAVQDQAEATERALLRLKRRDRFPHLEVIRASSFHGSSRHRAYRDEVWSKLGRDVHPYVVRQVADTAYFGDAYRKLWKVGWTLGSASSDSLDERFFDELFVECFGPSMGFLYCRPGCTLLDDQPRAAPYVAPEPDVRVCLSHKEAVGLKLARAKRAHQDQAIRRVRRHVGAILYSYRKHVSPIRRGQFEDRVDSLLVDALG